MSTSSSTGTSPIEIAFVKGETTARDVVWLDGRRVAVHVVHDLPHLAVESVFGLVDGLWGVLAAGGFEAANRAATLRFKRSARLVTDAPLGKLGDRNWTGHAVAKAATNAVVNRWGNGTDTPEGVRARMRTHPASPEAGRLLTELASRLHDAEIALAIETVRRLDARWAAEPAGGTLRLSWPLA